MDPFTLSDLGRIQGDILLNGIPKKFENIQTLPIATGDDVRKIRKKKISELESDEKFPGGQTKVIPPTQKVLAGLAADKKVPVALTNIALTSAGLQKLGGTVDSLRRGLPDLKEAAPSFWRGMQHPTERSALQDPPFQDWNAKIGSQTAKDSLDGVLIVAGSERHLVIAQLENVFFQLNNSSKTIKVVKDLGREEGMEREAEPAHEHFSFNDGISNPHINGINGRGDDLDAIGFQLDKVKQPDNDSNPVDPGVILIGRKGDPGALRNSHSNFPIAAKPSWATDCSFLVFRKLEQHVGVWDKFLETQAAQLKTSKELPGAQLMGRWKSGCPIHLSPAEDKPEWATRNDFTYDGMLNEGACPMAAHIRKAHIRMPHNLDFSRIMRRGIPYGGDWTGAGKDGGRGLLFACYQSAIEEGYRFIQKHWANDPKFPPGQQRGLDVTIGQGTGDPGKFVINATKSVPIKPANEFVTTMGGDYFFVPSIDLLKAGFDINKLKGPRAKLS